MTTNIAPADANTASYAPSASKPYSFEMAGNSMSPRIQQGETVYVDPALPLGIGDEVVLWNAERRAMVGWLLETTSETWRIAQMQSKGGEIDQAILELPVSEWSMCHRITAVRFR